MSLPCFHIDGDIDYGITALSASESAHALQSRRLKPGHDVVLLNGNGLVAKGLIESVTRREVFVDVTEKTLMPRVSPVLSVAVAMPKGDRQKILVDALSQLGVAKIVPIETEFSVSKLNDKHTQKLTRVIREACKQSQNPWYPQLAQPASLDDYMENVPNAYYADQFGLAISDISAGANYSEIVVLVGPEGGFSEAEQQKFSDKGFRSIKLGQHILRTETAALAISARFLCP